MREGIRKRRIWLMMALTASLVYIVRPSSAGDFQAKEVYEQTSKKVVLIIARSQGGYKSLGSGSIISDDGLVLTNAHVVDDQDSGQPCSDVRVFFKPEKVTGKFEKDLKNGTSASVVKFSSELDLALLSLQDAPLGLGKIEMADPEEIKIGEEVIAIGHPEHGGLWSLTYGRISGSIENYCNIPGKDVFQTDTSLNRGNSGGPLLDQRGYLAAVNSNIARLSEDKLPITGVNFAIKSSVVKSWLNQEGYSLIYGSKPLVEEPKETFVQAKPTEEAPIKEAPTKEEKVLALDQEKITAAEQGKASVHEPEKVPASEPEKVIAIEPEKVLAPAQEKAPIPAQDKTQAADQEKTPALAQEKAPILSAPDSVPDKAPALAQDKTQAADQEKTPALAQEKAPILSAPEKAQSTATEPKKQFQTPIQPYDRDALFRAVEADLEDMMQEMRQKIRQKK